MFLKFSIVQAERFFNCLTVDYLKIYNTCLSLNYKFMGKYMKKQVKIDEDTLLKAAQAPAKLARELHTFHRGKIEVVPKCRVKNLNDFSIWYSPGVAAVCTDISKKTRTCLRVYK
jgi:malic enzyme